MSILIGVQNMTKLTQAILIRQLNTCNLAIQYGKLNEEKMAKVLTIKNEILKKLGI